MLTGDLIEWAGQRWFVRSIERATHSAIIVSPTGEAEVIDQNLEQAQPEECKVHCNPPSQWPFLTVMPKARSGLLRAIHLPRLGEGPLAVFVDWVRPDNLQIGGSVFFNPALQLGWGDALVFVYDKSKFSVRVPRGFGTQVQRIEKAAPTPPPEPKTTMELLLEDDDL